MKRKQENLSKSIWLRILSLLGSFWFGLFVLSGCVVPPTGSPPPLNSTYTAVESPIQPSLSPTPTPTRTPTKTRTPTLTPTITPTPFPTPGTIQPNAIAFIAGSWQNYSGPDSLWVANVDGSGERQILNNFPRKDWRWFRWSPDGKWLSYLYKDELWIIEPDGENQQKVVETDPTWGGVGGYSWSPDSSKIVFSLGLGESAHDGGRVGIIEITSRQIQYLTDHAPHLSSYLSWSHDGNYIAFTGYLGPISFIDVRTGEIIAGTTVHDVCGGTLSAMEWSPDDTWLLHTHWGNGRYAQKSACITNLNGESIRIAPDFADFGRIEDAVWSKDGQFVYLSAFDASPDDPGIDPDPRLLRYDVLRRKYERITSQQLSLTPPDYAFSISPNKEILSRLFQISRDNSFSLELYFTSTGQKTNYTLNYPIILVSPHKRVWSADNSHIIFIVGQKNTPNDIGVRDYGAFYSIDILTGQILPLTGEHWIKAWVISPVVDTAPFP